MSFARFSNDSDVSVYEADDGFTCCGCPLNGDMTVQTTTAYEMADHVDLHEMLGHRVPEDLVDDLLSGDPNRG